MKIGVIIISCDKFKDTWSVVSESFDRHFPYSLFNVYLLSNHLEFKHNLINNIRVGDDLSWSENLKKALKTIPESHVLLWLDDVFLSDTINQNQIFKIFSFMEKWDPNYLRLSTSLSPSYWLDSDFGVIKSNALYYRSSIFASIWKKNVLIDLLVDGESAWDFEIFGSDRTKTYEGFYSIKHDIFNYIHGIEKGFWIREAAVKLKELGYKLDFTYRPLMSNKNQNIVFRYSKLKKLLLRITPAKFRKDLLLMYQIIIKPIFR